MVDDFPDDLASFAFCDVGYTACVDDENVSTLFFVHCCYACIFQAMPDS